MPIIEHFPDEQLLVVTATNLPWFTDYVNYSASGVIPSESDWTQKRKFMRDVKEYLWDELFLFKRCPNGIIRKCIPDEEQDDILKACHATEYGGITEGKEPPSRYYNVNFIGQVSIWTLRELLQHVTDVKEQGTSKGKMRCL